MYCTRINCILRRGKLHIFFPIDLKILQNCEKKGWKWISNLIYAPEMQREIHICIAPPQTPVVSCTIVCNIYISCINNAYLNCEVVDISDRVKGMRDLVLLVEVKLAEHGDIPHVQWVRGGTQGQILLRACTVYISDSEPDKSGSLPESSRTNPTPDNFVFHTIV